MFRKGLRGLAPDGTADTGFPGREMTRNAAIGDLALATGLRLGEFTHLLPWEIPALPSAPTAIPIPFPVPGGITKGRKFRTTWISYDALAGLHDYLQLDRAAATDGSSLATAAAVGRTAEVTTRMPVAAGSTASAASWESLTPAERRRLVAPDGGSCLLAVRGDGGPFTAWATVFERTADRIRARFEPRFPHVHPHRLRHSFSMQTLEYLVTGYYRQAAKLVRDTDADAALVFYLTKADPLLVLRDLFGHSTVLDHREVPETPGYDPDLPASLRNRRSGSRTHRRYRRTAGSRRRVRRRQRRETGDADDGRRESTGHHAACSATAAGRSST